MDCHMEKMCCVFALIKVFWCVQGRKRWMVVFNEEAPVLEKNYFPIFALDILREF